MNTNPVLHVLIVDDDKDTADSFASLFKLWGHEATAAMTADAALDSVRRFVPDLILADVAMPRASGLKFAAMLRQMPEHRTTRLIAVTGMQGYRDACVQAGFDDFLLKPVNIDELQQIVGTVQRADPRGAVRAVDCHAFEVGAR
jgi:CheY-like chemotaxis protein